MEAPPLLSVQIAERVRRYIKTNGLKKKALASALSITENQAYWRIAGRTPFDVDELPGVAGFMSTSLADLVQPAELAEP